MAAEPTAAQRKMWAKMGWAMPDGSYYIRPLAQGGADDLQNAILAIGRAKAPPNASQTDQQAQNAARRHVIARAKALKLQNKIPATWNSDGTLKPAKSAAQSSMVDDFLDQLLNSDGELTEPDHVDGFLEHFGVKGMKWGVHRSKTEKAPASADSEKTAAIRSKAKVSGKSSLSNEELQSAITRLNLERQYASLTVSDLSPGKRLAAEILGTGSNVAKQQASSAANQVVAKQVKKLVEKTG